MARKKASDLLEVKELPAPIIKHTFDKSTYWKDHTIILHIVDRGGHMLQSGWTGRVEKHSYGLTRCNVVEDYWENGSNWSKFNDAVDWDGKDGGYRFCPRCGTPDDFEKAIVDLDTQRREWSEKYKQEQEDERVLMEQRWSRTKLALLEVEGHIQETGFHTSYEDGDGYFSIEYEKDGRRYLVKVSVQEIEEGEDE